MCPTQPPTFSAETRRRLVASLPFTEAPATIRNTWTGSATRRKVPSLIFESAGAVAETNKLAELALIQVDPVIGGTFFGPGSTVGPYDFRFSVRMQMVADTATPANVSSSAVAGIQLGSDCSATLTTTPSNSQGVVRLARVLSTPNRFQFWRAMGDGSAGISTVFDVTDPASATVTVGHLVELVWDPFALTITALVNNRVRAVHSESLHGWMPPVASFGDANNVALGLVVYSGTQTAATKTLVQWTAPTLEWLGTSEIGSGLV